MVKKSSASFLAAPLLFGGLGLAVVLALPTQPVLAQSPAGQTVLTQEPVYQDDITLELKTEDWLTSKSVRLFIHITAAFNEKDSQSIRTQVENRLRQIAPEADWKITSFTRKPGAAGLEQWNISAETRVQDKALDGLRNKIRESNKPGFEITLRHMTYSPTEEEEQALYATLRKKIYDMAKAELATLNALFKDRKYRVSRIDFSPSALQYGRRDMALQEAAPKAYAISRDSGPSDMAVSRKIQLHATVILSANHLPTR
ncbi:hypothetical protein [Luteithermobacter gelatinilyticus]|uniref:hypothetical protein n=1 Tax=Luteithermobacter gelatinilyticus TaxID=2582913 RepID=UPI0011059A7E|nr:hypothetical protein [Luteithermobacter gelatinilyticus]